MRTLIAAVLVFAVCTPVASARTWTDSTGKHTVEAEFVDLKGGKVRLKKANGSTLSITLDKLSSADQEYVRNQTKRGDSKKPVNGESRLNSPPKDSADSSPSEPAIEEKDVEKALKESIGAAMLGALSKNKTMPLYVQKRKDEFGIHVNRAFGVVTASASSYSDTKTSIETSEIKRLLIQSAAAGKKAEVQPSFVFGKGVQTYIIGVQVNSANVGKTLLEEVKKRFEFEPPLTFNFWIDERGNLYLDAYKR